MRKTSTLVHGVVAAAATALVITGCSSSGSDGANNQIVLADGQELGDFNPLTYYGSLGVSPIYQGLLAPSADDDSRVPDLVPALAASAPERVAPRIWRVPLRTGVTFSDGTMPSNRYGDGSASVAMVTFTAAPSAAIATIGSKSVAISLATFGSRTAS